MLGVRRFALALLLALLFVSLRAVPAVAQIGPRGGYPPCYPECDVKVIIDPANVEGDTVHNSALDVDVTFCGEANLHASSRLIRLRGTDVTDDFTYTSGGSSECTYARKTLSEDEITLTTGANSFYAYICDVYNNCSAKTVTYYYTEVEEAPTLDLVNHNGDNRDRSKCLTAGAGEGAAYQCGDLMVAHSMPGYATKGRDRALTLIYNSSQAEPRPAIAVNVTNISAMTTPDEIAAELVIDGDTVASATYTQWTGDTKQIVLAFDGSSLSSGLHEFTLKAHNVYTGGPQTSNTITDTLIVVNRSTSEFGRGWSVAGVEELVTGQLGNNILWIGGDGSAKRYRNVASNTWQAAEGGYRDTLTFSTGTSTYTRTLRHGVKVDYNSSGQHIRTENRAGDITRLTWSGTPSRLQSIRVPPDTTIDGNTYVFGYDGSSKLDSIADPAGRKLDATVASGELTRLTDPDADYVAFHYDAQGRMDTLTNRRGVKTEYAYDNDLRLTDAVIPLNVTAGDTATTTYSSWDERGLALGTGSTNVTASRTYHVYTQINGPRTVSDISTFWIDRWGAPTKIRDPLLNETDITRSTAGLPTQVEYEDGRVVKMSWDPRANLTEQRDSTLQVDGLTTAVTSYFYDAVDSPDSIADPTGVKTRFKYNASGLPDTITAPNGHKTAFDYGSSAAEKGLVTSVTEKSVSTYVVSTKTESSSDQETTFTFNGLGNVITETSPGNHTRTFRRDTVERVYRVIDAVDDSTTYTHDNLNRVTRVRVHDGATSYDTDYTYTDDFLTKVEDPRDVPRSYAYDDAGRLIKETDETETYYDEHVYDPAGLRVLTRTRVSGDSIRFEYDVAGRLELKAWTARDSVPADSLMYWYDTAGRIDSVKNAADAIPLKVVRTYYGNGLLETEVQSRANGNDAFTDAYEYDAAGRRTLYVIGGTSPRDSVAYDYDNTTGELESIRVRWRSGVRDTVSFVWDELGRRDTLYYSSLSASGGGSPTPITVGLAYDADGNLRRLCSTHDGLEQTASDVFKIRVAYDTLNADGTVRYLTMGTTGSDTDCTASNIDISDFFNRNVYDGRKQLVSQATNGDSLFFAYDASGNMTERSRYNGSGGGLRQQEKYRIPAGSNRMDRYWPDYDESDTTYTDYDYYTDGNRATEVPAPVSGVLGLRYYVYDALGQMTGTEEYAVTLFYDGEGQYSGSGLSWVENGEACKYDPFGRRVDPCGDPLAYLGFDGHNVVRTGADADSTAAWTFVHGPGTDDPLMGIYEYGEGSYLYLYWVTDGQGRQYGVGKATGQNYAGEQEYMNNGGKYAGGATAASGFGIERNPNGDLHQLSFFRNRYYDQQTGRWTQEDPLGVAAGTNLYSYVGNDPATYTDPFGLMPCDPPGSCTALFIAAGGAIGARIGAVLAGAGGPTVLVGAGAGFVLGSALGGLTGAVAENSGAILESVQAAGRSLSGLLNSAFASDDRSADQVISDDKRATIRRVFPGEMLGKTQDEIDKIAKDKRSPDQQAARRAKKLLKSRRFDKDQ